MKRAHLGLAGVLGLWALAAGGPAAADILIATAGPLKGQYAGFGEQARRGAEMAVQAINAAGGLLGQKLVLEAADDACDSRRGLAVAKELIGKRVVFMAGHFCSFASAAVADEYAKAGVVMISPASTSPDFTEKGGWNTHRVVARDDAQGTEAGRRLARDFAGRKVVILHDGTGYGAGLAGKATAAMNSAGLREAAVLVYTPGSGAFGPLLERIKAAGANAIYIGGSAVDAGAILRQAKEQGLALQAFGADALATPDFWSAAAEAGEGTQLTFPPDPQKLEAAAFVVEKFKAADFAPEGHTLQSHAAVELWAAAAAATGGTDGPRIAAWLRAGNRVKTVLGEIALDAKGDLAQPRFIWLKWSGGQLAEAP